MLNDFAVRGDVVCLSCTPLLVMPRVQVVERLLTRKIDIAWFSFLEQGEEFRLKLRLGRDRYELFVIPDTTLAPSINGKAILVWRNIGRACGALF